MDRISIKKLKELLWHDPHNGVLHWYERPLDMFPDDRSGKIWNTRFAGKEALTAVSGCGYKHGIILGSHYRLHRVLWALHYGEWPKDQIDHINHDRVDNRIKNLRPATQKENQKNQSLSIRNKSGTSGVHRSKNGKKWTAWIGVDGVSTYLGVFGCLTAAIVARKQAELEYSFHPNHGRR